MELAATSSRDHSSVARPKRQTRSRITNGTSIHLVAVDGRSAAARRFRDVLAEIISDLGGPGHLSEGQRQIARRCAMLCVTCEQIEAQGIAGEAIDIDAYGALADRIGRAFQRLGLKRVARNVTPTLADLLREDREAQMRGGDGHED
jgi:hypothetical protein